MLRFTQQAGAEGVSITNAIKSLDMHHYDALWIIRGMLNEGTLARLENGYLVCKLPVEIKD